jgi:hypothetical protein
MQLLVDPLVHTDTANLIDVAGTRTERQPIQYVNGLFV